jgi:polysaccharide biosynthesis transport protein
MNTAFSRPRLTSAAERHAPPSDEGQDVIDLGSLIRTLWRGKLVIGAAIVLMLMLGAYYAYAVATPKFRTAAVVMLNNREEQVVDLESVIGGLSADSSVVNTEVEVLKSRGLLGKVVDELNLTQDPEFNSGLRDPSMVARLKETVKSFLPGRPAGVGSTGLNEETFAHQATVNALLSSITIRNVPQSLVFEVVVETESPRKSALIADTLVDLYILNQLEVKFEATEQATSWLTDRVTELQSSLEVAEQRVTDFRGGIDLISPQSLDAMERQLKELRDRLANTRVQQATGADRLETIRQAETPQEKAAATGDAQLEAMLPRVSEPAISQSFETRFQMLLSRLEADDQRQLNQISALATSEAELSSQIERQSNDLITLQQYTREAEASRLLYEYFLSRLKETAAQKGIQQADSRVLSSAVIPMSPAAPRKAMIVALSGLFGFLIGAALVLIREAYNDTFRTAQMLEQATGYTVMGQVPVLPIRRRQDGIKYLAEKPTSAAAEAIRNLRTSVLLSNVDNPPKVIVMSSSLPGEGKTTMSLALAQNFAGMGKKVLLIEGDIRRKVMSRSVSSGNQKGLISVLTGKSSLEEAVFRDEDVGADILIGESTTTNAADLFTSERFAALIEYARSKYDQIVIDTPPVLVVTDARIIAQVADAVLFVVHWDRTQKQSAVEAVRLFESVNHPVSGLILNQINFKAMKRYGYGSYGSYGAYAYGSKYYIN